MGINYIPISTFFFAGFPVAINIINSFWLGMLKSDVRFFKMFLLGKKYETYSSSSSWVRPLGPRLPIRAVKGHFSTACHDGFG